jgi:site-specific DNA recombinase
MTTSPIRAAIYCRISSDPTGLAAGVERQESDCREFCDRAGWDVAEVYVDNDLSAYSGKPRPAYARLMADIEAGRINALVAWHLDRLHRRPAELEEFIETCERAGLTRIKTLHGDVDLTNSSGRLHARMMGVVARHSSEHSSERIRRKLRDSAEKGKPWPGGVRGYGYEADGRTIRPDEAAVIREAAERVLAGESLRQILADFNRRGVPTVRGGRWAFTTLRQMLTAPRLAGLRTHHGRVVAEGDWPPILSRETHELLVATLEARKPEKKGRPFSYLLTGGTAVCGICGVALASKPQQGIPRYVCSTDDGGCGGIAIRGLALEAYVRDYVLDALAGDYPIPSAQPTAASPDLAARLAGYRERYERLTEEYAVEGLYDKATYLRLRSELAAKIEEAQQALAPSAASAIPASWRYLSADELAPLWDALPNGERREIVKALVASVAVHPFRKDRPRRFDPERVTIYPAWAENAGISAGELAGLVKPLAAK